MADGSSDNEWDGGRPSLEEEAELYSILHYSETLVIGEPEEDDDLQGLSLRLSDGIVGGSPIADCGVSREGPGTSGDLDSKITAMFEKADKPSPTDSGINDDCLSSSSSAVESGEDSDEEDDPNIKVLDAADDPCKSFLDSMTALTDRDEAKVIVLSSDVEDDAEVEVTVQGKKRTTLKSAPVYQISSSGTDSEVELLPGTTKLVLATPKSSIMPPATSKPKLKRPLVSVTEDCLPTSKQKSVASKVVQRVQKSAAQKVDDLKTSRKRARPASSSSSGDSSDSETDDVQLITPNAKAGKLTLNMAKERYWRGSNKEAYHEVRLCKSKEIIYSNVSGKKIDYSDINFTLDDILESLPDNPENWRNHTSNEIVKRLKEAGLYNPNPPNSRPHLTCENCGRTGHLHTSCLEPFTLPRCKSCGQFHRARKPCPKPYCLNCRVQTKVFHFHGCPKCCADCMDLGNQQQICGESTTNTSTKEISSSGHQGEKASSMKRWRQKMKMKKKAAKIEKAAALKLNHENKIFFRDSFNRSSPNAARTKERPGPAKAFSKVSSMLRYLENVSRSYSKKSSAAGDGPREQIAKETGALKTMLSKGQQKLSEPHRFKILSLVNRLAKKNSGIRR